MNQSATTQTVMQCEGCLRYFIEGVPVELRISEVGLPVSFVCGRVDCAAIQVANERVDSGKSMALQRVAFETRRRIREAKVNAKLKIQNSKCRKGKSKTSNAERRTPNIQGPSAALGAAARCLRSPALVDHRLAKDTECSDRSVEILSTADNGAEGHLRPTVVGSSQEEYLAAVDVSVANGRLLAYFQAHFNVWIPMVVLKRVAEIEVPHSRMPELRAALQPHLDIDQKSLFYEPTGRAHSHYRLCLKSESVRLKRKAERDVNQGEFSTTDRHG